MAANLGTGDVTSGGITMPEWYLQLTNNLANDVNSSLDNAANLSQNWYSNPVAAPLTTLQNNATAKAENPLDVSGLFNNAKTSLSNFKTQFDPADLAKFMNPYVDKVNADVATLGARNLTENILPGINSTFTGSGQFGSSRNTDFTLRAMRDANAGILQTQNKNLNDMFMKAMDENQEWNNNNLTLASADMATGQGGLQQFWQNLNNQYNMGQQQQGAQQNVLNANYQDWLNSNAIPQNMLGALTQMIPQISQMYTKTPVSSANTSVPLTSPTGVGGLGQIASAAGNLLAPNG